MKKETNVGLDGLRKRQLAVTLPGELHTRLKLLAAMQGLTMSAIIIEAVTAAVELGEEELGTGVTGELDRAFDAAVAK